MVERKNILIPIYTYICTLSAGGVCIPVIDVDMPHLRATRVHTSVYACTQTHRVRLPSDKIYREPNLVLVAYAGMKPCMDPSWLPIHTQIKYESSYTSAHSPILYPTVWSVAFLPVEEVLTLHLLQLFELLPEPSLAAAHLLTELLHARGYVCRDYSCCVERLFQVEHST